MDNLEYSVPYNGDPETLEEIFKLAGSSKNIIREIYLSGPQLYSGSGRVMPPLNDHEFIEIIEQIRSKKIRINLLMNSTCEGSSWYLPELMSFKLSYLERIHKDHGVEAVTVANPIYIKHIRGLLPNIEICASVLADIDCVQRADIYTRAGADILTIDVNINRDLDLLEEIKDTTGAELKLMVNEGCLYKCPLRKFHLNYTSHKAKELGIEGDHLFNLECNEIISEDNSQILKSCWIRPEDTSKYKKITKFFKIVGRELPRNTLLRSVKAYLDENWHGDIMDILCASLKKFSLLHAAYLDNKSLDRYRFFETVTSCHRNCGRCNYCNELAKNLVKFGVISNGKLDDVGLEDMADNLRAAAKLS
ncbi:Protease [uncultured Desulfobacterium sp.]|uniref:Protease n=1 Tax=uncultured Desulfobacterium sp. TaxID=201089 RepID=A0A445MXE7_9BACT|nr:Protease [uncultured Desulfobacterium sp.]